MMLVNPKDAKSIMKRKIWCHLALQGAETVINHKVTRASQVIPQPITTLAIPTESPITQGGVDYGMDKPCMCLWRKQKDIYHSFRVVFLYPCSLHATKSPSTYCDNALQQPYSNTHTAPRGHRLQSANDDGHQGHFGHSQLILRSSVEYFF